VNVEPALTPPEALALAERDLLPSGPYAVPPTADKVIWRLPDQAGSAEPRYALAYHIQTRLEHGPRETAHITYVIDAQTGAILKKWDDLRTTAAKGKGLTQYSGTVDLDVDDTGKGYQLRDLTRGKGGAFGHNVVTNLDHSENGKGEIFLNPGAAWGDHRNYSGDKLPTTGPTGQTAMADAAYGNAVTWDMYRHVFGRKGIDGKDTATYSRVHYGTSYENAFWDDSCFCMTYGDGATLKSLESIDVAGHEMSHGVCSSTANLAYTGESGGLNESNSDIFGTMAEFYARGGGFKTSASTIPEKGGNWTLGEQLGAQPLRWMDKPSKDGMSPDEWSESLASLDVHNSSGPMNRCFYFLSQGASGAEGDHHSKHLPSGMKGVGNQVAARIWYRTLSTYLTSTSDYAATRAGAIRAATDLYGAGSKAERAVQKAFHGINVGPDWSPITATILRPATDAVIVSGTRLAFEGKAVDALPGTSLTFGWIFGDGGVAEGARATHTYRLPGTEDATFTATLNVLDDQGNLGSATRSITVTPSPAAHPERILNGGFEEGDQGWGGDTYCIGTFDGQPPYAGRVNALFMGLGIPLAMNLHQDVAIPPARSATLTFRLHVTTNQPLPAPTDLFRVQVLDRKGTLIKEVAAYSNQDANAGYALETVDLSSFTAQAIRLNFQAAGGWLFKTSFALDEVSLVVR
jgi:Zn-dependent metalloprotease